MFRRIAVTGALVAGILTIRPAPAAAFCGFYVSGADAELFNDATQVVLMRHGTRTVLSMQNSYKGPTEDFAMVVPVPEVLSEDNVKTLSDDIFARVDKLSAPRLVEYWEVDPCYVEPDYAEEKMMGEVPAEMTGSADDDGVTVEAQFEVGEYEIVILSATESTGLERWLNKNEYNIPEGAAPLFKPYIEGGLKFFVAKVNAEKVTFEDGMAVLSPLRFHYDSEKFFLPVRLGLINAEAEQDLIVHIFAKGQRYHMANMDNVTIPTNIDLAEDAKTRFGEFYAALFDRTLEKHPGAVVTEYAWDASTCDPCPQPPLEPEELATLGADVAVEDGDTYGFVHTRLHVRYDKESLEDDLVFEEAPPIAGGREHFARDGELEKTAQPYGSNQFQGRYAIRHPWKKEIDCKEPVRGRWGGPWEGGGAAGPQAATNLAHAPRGSLELPKVVRRDLPEIEVEAELEPVLAAAEKDGQGEEKDQDEDQKNDQKEKKSGGCCDSGGGGAPAGALLLGVVVAIAIRRRARA